MVFKSLRIFVLSTKVAIASEGLSAMLVRKRSSGVCAVRHYHHPQLFRPDQSAAVCHEQMVEAFSYSHTSFCQQVIERTRGAVGYGGKPKFPHEWGTEGGPP